AIFCVATNADGSALASGGEDGSVRIWLAPPAEPVALDQGASLAFSPDGRLLAVVPKDSKKSTRLYEVGTWKPGPTPVPLSYCRVSWCPQSRLLAGRAKVWLPGGPARPSLQVPNEERTAVTVLGMTFSPDGRMVAGINSDLSSKKGVNLWEVATGKWVR